MLYRTIGKTGMSASVVGLGAEHLDNRPYALVEEVVRAAIEAEMNIIDVFMPGKPVRENIAKALGTARKDVLVQGHIGSVDLREQYDRTRDVDVCRKYFEDLLRCFGGYIDLGMMFFVDTAEDYRQVFETEYIDYVLDLKREGKIRAIGASSHNPKTAAKIVETGVADLLMFSVNPAFDMLPVDMTIEDMLEKKEYEEEMGMEAARMRLYRLCESRGVAITTMKTLGAGKLLTREFSPFDRPLTAVQCIHYALTRPAVVSALIGCKSREEVREAARYLQAGEEEKDFGSVIQNRKSMMRAQCLYCNHCLPCPAGIDIAAVTRLLDAAESDAQESSGRPAEQYRLLENAASGCIACGSCEERCPFGVHVIENMERAARLFEG